MDQSKRILKRAVFFLPLALLIALFECIPLMGMVVKAFLADGQLSLGNFIKAFQEPAYQVAMLNSLWITILSSLAGLVVDFFLAMALSGSRGRGKSWYLSLLNLTSTFSGVPLTIAFITTLGTSGVFVLMAQQVGFLPLADYNLYSVAGMFIIYLYFQIPMGTLLMLPVFEKVRKEWREASSLMGAGQLRFWARIAIPVMMPGILGTFNMLFANAIAAYATPYLLVNNSVALLPTKIVDMFVGDVRQRPGLGSALSLVLLAFVILEITLTNLCKRHFEKFEKGGR
ncbi:ABC transporter permease subunit [Oscillospiraceae bacterium 21-37]|uniref:ABC transporter permease n=1 Tax=Acutalibacter muris TaxID=1796620 RepID=UPI00272EE20F|nr:ABC transporter permease subunit [Acutalibacter muris]